MHTKRTCAAAVAAASFVLQLPAIASVAFEFFSVQNELSLHMPLGKWHRKLTNSSNNNNKNNITTSYLNSYSEPYPYAFFRTLEAMLFQLF